MEKLYCLAVQTAAVTASLITIYTWAAGICIDEHNPQPADWLKTVVSLPIMLADVWLSRVPFVSYHFQVSSPTKPHYVSK